MFIEVFIFPLTFSTVTYDIETSDLIIYVGDPLVQPVIYVLLFCFNTSSNCD